MLAIMNLFQTFNPNNPYFPKFPWNFWLKVTEGVNFKVLVWGLNELINIRCPACFLA